MAHCKQAVLLVVLILGCSADSTITDHHRTPAIVNHQVFENTIIENQPAARRILIRVAVPIDATSSQQTSVMDHVLGDTLTRTDLHGSLEPTAVFIYCYATPQPARSSDWICRLEMIDPAAPRIFHTNPMAQ